MMNTQSTQRTQRTNEHIMTSSTPTQTNQTTNQTTIPRSFSFQMLLKRNSTFWPTNEEIITRHPSILIKHPSLELLNPEFSSSKRQSSSLSSIFNLVATVCGGGVLTLPYAFSLAGVIPSTILMIFSAIITDFAMYILCSCARRTGGKSYGDVTRIAFGNQAELFVTMLLFIFLYFVVVAYFVLVKDIWTPVLLHMVPSLSTYINNNVIIQRWVCGGGGGGDIVVVECDHDNNVNVLSSDVFLIGFIIISLPLLFKTNLHALRHTCYIGFASLIILVYAIVIRSYELNFVTNIGIFGKQVKWWPEDKEDVIAAFPIISLSFFSIYNVLSVHSALTNPTRQRVKFVIDGTITLCFM